MLAGPSVRSFLRAILKSVEQLEVKGKLPDFITVVSMEEVCLQFVSDYSFVALA